MLNAKQIAQLEWREDLDLESILILDERLGIIAFRVRNTWQPRIGWNAISFPFTDSMIDDLASWKEATKQRKE
jgi:hypothetical protein